MPGEFIECKSHDECVDDEHRAMFDSDYLHRLESSGLPSHNICLKRHAVIVLMRNLDVAGGHCNGTRYAVLDVTSNFIMAQKLNGAEHDIILVPKLLCASDENDLGFVFTRLQFPVMLAYYMTFNRAQGQSVEKCGLLLPQSLFTHGQLYVGLSRCGDPKNVFACANQEEFWALDFDFDHNVTYTRNIVHKEVFND